MDYTFLIMVGDWSLDGHNQVDFLPYKTNIRLDILHEAYFASCKKYKYSFHESELLVGVKTLFCDYEENYLKPAAHKLFVSLNLPVKPLKESYNTDEYINLLFNFIKLSIPDFKWEEAAITRSELKNLLCFNYIDDETVTGSFGYGLYN